jgi:regulator of protease activity HflC (stomatin/prohibitin superfamily)
MLLMGSAIVYLFLIFIGLIILGQAIRVLREYERGVIFRLGRLVGAKGPGLIILIPIIDKMVKVSLRTVAMDVPSQDIISRDNVSLKVNAVLYFRVIDPQKAIVEIEDYLYATSQIAQTTLRSVLGQWRWMSCWLPGKARSTLQQIIDQHTDPWGVKVSAVEVSMWIFPEMQRQWPSRRPKEKRAKIIHARAN